MITVLDPLLTDEEASELVDLWHDYGTYGQYSNEGFDTSYAPELSQRYDAAVNFVRTGGRFGRREAPSTLAEIAGESWCLARLTGGRRSSRRRQIAAEGR